MTLDELDIEKIQQSFQKYAQLSAFNELTAPAYVDPVAVILMKKHAGVDPTIFSVAVELSPGDPYAMYKTLGGQYNSEDNNAR